MVRTPVRNKYCKPQVESAHGGPDQSEDVLRLAQLTLRDLETTHTFSYPTKPYVCIYLPHIPEQTDRVGIIGNEAMVSGSGMR